MAGVNFITHNGVRILYEDFSSLNNTEELLAFIEQAKTIIHQQPEKSVLALVNVKDSKFDNSVSSALKELAKSNEPYMKCAAVYGVEGLKEIIYRAIIGFTGRKNLVLFKNLEEAKDFLSKQK